MNRRKKPTLALRMVIVLFCLMGIYYLSFGPACWMVDRGVLPLLSVARSYRPLILVAQHVPPADRLLVWYAGLGARNESIGSAITASALLMKNPH
jgi:hypothetical protein